METLFAGGFVVTLLLAGVTADCPKDLTTRIQQCAMNNDALTAASSPQDPDQAKTFCHDRMTAATECVNKYISVCSGDPWAKEVFRIMVDVDNLKSGMQYFCDHLHILQNKSICLVEMPSVAPCVMEAVGTFQNEMGEISSVKLALDETCRLFNDMSNCFLSRLPEGCKEVETMFSKLLLASRFPYCTYSEVDKIQAAGKLEAMKNPMPGSAPTLHLTWPLLVLLGLVSLQNL